MAELNRAEKVIVKLIQHHHYSKEINDLKSLKSDIDNDEQNANSFETKGLKLHDKSSLIPLDPFIDKDDVIRVGGRLRFSEISYDQKHQIILPPSHFVTDLIIKHYHNEHKHAGCQTTLYALREKYWIVNGRSRIRNIIRKCIICFRIKPRMANYKMGDLPECRVTKSELFSNVGIDYCGPFWIKEKKLRNRSRIKIWVCVYVCMASKAVHLEIVSDLSTQGFLGSFRRFIGRRGCPTNLFSDNGTNFTGANHELADLYELVKSPIYQDKMINYASTKGIEWHFIPPRAPHFGGLWESTVKMFKHYFKRTIGNVNH